MNLINQKSVKQGIYPIITNNTNLLVQHNYINNNYSNNDIILAIQSNVDFKKTNNITITNKKLNNFVATDNSKIYIENYSISGYSTVLSHNTIVNFPFLNTNLLSSNNLQDILIYTNGKFSINGLVLNTEQSGYINLFQWTKQLINDGSIYKFYNDVNINNIVIPYKIKSFIINTVSQSQLNKCLQFIPKDLHQSKLIIYPASLTYNLSGFYNGTIEISGNINNIISPVFNFQNCDNIKISTLNINGNYYNNNSYPFSCKYVKSLILENSNISNNVGSNLNYISYVNSLDPILCKANILSDVSNIYKYGVIGTFQTSNIIIENCIFNQKTYNEGGYKNYLTFIAYKNTSLVSHSNYFYYNEKTYLNKRPIIFYTANNSKITAYNDIYNDKSTMLTNQSNINQPISASVIYGYQSIGGIFNHNHSSHILKTVYTKQKNIISNDLPVGSIYILSKKMTDTCFTSTTGQEYSTYKFVGYMPAQSNMKFGVSLPNNYFYQTLIYSIPTPISTTFNQYISDRQILPNNNISTISSKYADDISYFQKYYSIDLQSRFIYINTTKTSFTDIDQFLNLSTNLVQNIELSANIWNNVLYKFDNNYKTSVKYSQYTKYDKGTLLCKSKIQSKLK